jgi:hypothetical protein
MAKTYFISPAGIVNHPHLVTPDTEGQYATGKFTTKLILTPEAAKPLIDLIAKEAASHKAGKACKLPFKAETRKDGDGDPVKTGNVQFSMSSKYAPAIINPKTNKALDLRKMGDDFDIGRGSRVKVAGEVYSYDKGLSLQMSQVMLLDLVNGRASVFGDDDTDGTFDGSDYESDNAPAASSFTESNVAAMGI